MGNWKPYILHLLAFVEIRLFNVFLWERKAGFGKLMKNVRDAGFSRKRGGNAGSGPPLPDPLNVTGQNYIEVKIFQPRLILNFLFMN